MGQAEVGRAAVLVQLDERRERPLAEAVQLLGEEVDLLGVPLRRVHELLAGLDLPEALVRRLDRGLVLLDPPAAADDLRLLAALVAALRPAALRSAKTPDVLALDHILLELAQLLLQHGVLRLPLLGGVRAGEVHLLQRSLLLRRVALQVFDLAVEQLGLGPVPGLLAPFEEGLQALRDPQHVHVLGPLLEVQGLHLQHLVLPLDQAQLLAELLNRLQGGDLVFAELKDPPIARFDGFAADDDGVGIIGDHGRLRNFHLPLLELEKHFDVVLLPLHQVHMLGKFLLKLPMDLFGTVALGLVMRLQAAHLGQLGRAALHLRLDRQALPAQFEHPLEARVVHALGAFQDDVLARGVGSRVHGGGAEVGVRVDPGRQRGGRGSDVDHLRPAAALALPPILVLRRRRARRKRLLLPEELEERADDLRLEAGGRELLAEVLRGGGLALLPHPVVLPRPLAGHLG
mmetsp:Transcript_95530/g.292184  ORF Transcript_95530/g.292184 Transcript_95530/m.292184 type:complete len:459 (+) Transcript_95530:48-1424(+)